jgi:hypothetical protein
MPYDNFLYGFKGTPSARHCLRPEAVDLAGIRTRRRTASVTATEINWTAGFQAGQTRVTGRQASAAPYTKRASGRGGLPHVRRPGIPPRQYPPLRGPRRCRACKN